MPNDLDDTPLDDDTEPSTPLEVVDKTPKDKQWNDSTEDSEYDEHNITEEEIKEHGNS